MEQFLSTIEWGTAGVSFLLAYVLGWVWYSPVMFMKKWMAGKGAGVVEHPMWMSVLAQAGATFLLAVIINIFMAYDNLPMSVLVTLTIAGFIKANGMFAGKTKYAVIVETMYVIVMGALMILVNTWM